MTEHDTEFIRKLETILNGKGKVKVQIQAWWINVGIWAFGLLCATLGWVWSGKMQLSELTHQLAVTAEHNQAAQRDLSNRISLNSRQSWTFAQQRSYNSWIESLNRNNTNQLRVPDVDQIRIWYPIDGGL
jgi:hypothetical protein